MALSHYSAVYFPQGVVLMRALRDMNLPKFVFEDVPLFLGLIQDLFPGIDCPRVRYPNFNDAVEETLTKNKYIMLPDQVGTFSSYSYFYFWICIGNYFAIDTGDALCTLDQEQWRDFET